VAEYLNLYIVGGWRPAGKGAPREFRCPADGRLVAMGAEGSTADMHAAIAAAREAFDTGPRPERQRADVLRRTAGIGGTEAGHVVDADKVDAISGPVREPVGVCRLITPSNYPLLQPIRQDAPALLAGNTVVLKPSELTPSTAALPMRALEETGLPAGVANLILGAGPTAGVPLSEHPDVDMASFTGGVPSGTRVIAPAAPAVKRVALEFGGKNPNGVFADANFETAVDFALTAVFLHSGQVFGRRPAHHRRAVIARSVRRRGCRTRRADHARRAIRSGRRYRPTDLGRPRDKFKAYVDAGLAEGAVLRCGGRRPEDAHLRDGSFYPRTVLDGFHSGMSATQDESFGPVLAVETFTDEDEAVRLPNHTVYGLAEAVWTRDTRKAQRVANRLRHGTLWINDYHPTCRGGMKRSGHGRELGRVLDEYGEIKHIWQNANPRPERWFRGATAFRSTDSPRS
jgi:betaine-aldehyde dehydrogenase